MQCLSCQHENRDTAKFCEECAAALPRRCGGCGAELRPTAKFCDECSAAVTTRGAAPERDPRAYTPKHLADKILRSKSALEGERKQVTVLFADVKGSMELAEQVDPEEWHRILDRFFEILADGVHRFEGTINQYTGDGIMALFGAPIAHEDHAQRACYAALHLREELRRYVEEMKRTRGLNFSVRMGLNSGEVVVGKIGNDLRMDYTAQGHTVGLAQRIEQLASPEMAYLSQHTARLVEGFFQLRDLGLFDLKGVREPLHVYELQDVTAIRSRFEVSRARGLSKFVGRTSETGILDAALTSALDGQGQVVGVVGEAGVGKSRLCHELAERCRARGLPVTEAHGVAHGKAVSLLPVLDYLRGYFGITEQDTERASREKIAGRLLLLDPDLREDLPLLFDFLGVPDRERAGPRDDPEGRQRRLFATLKRVMHARSRHEPAVSVFEDLHWLDGASEAFLEHFVEAVVGTRTLLVVTFRPGYDAAWMKNSYYQPLPLLPLGPEAIHELLDDLLGRDASTAGLAPMIHERTGGNPFFTEELVQSLIESGHLEGVRGDFRLVAPLGELTVPPTVQAVLAARIDRLLERDKQALQTAAVVGKQFNRPILEAVSELSELDLTEALGALKDSEFVYEQAIYPVQEYAFKHPLTQEVAYGSQLRERRSQIHGSVARAIAALHPDKLDEQAALLAYHWEEAGDALQAAAWHARAGQWLDLTDPVETLAHWRNVRSLLEGCPESPEATELGLHACSEILRVGWNAGLTDGEAAGVFAAGEKWARQSGDPAARLMLVLNYCAYLVFSGAANQALPLLVKVVPEVESLGDPELESRALGTLMFTRLYLGQIGAALAASDRLARLVEAHPHAISPDRLAQNLTVRGQLLTYAGRLREASDALREAERVLQQSDLPLGIVHGFASWLAEHSGDAEAALVRARLLVEHGKRVDNPLMSRFGLMLEGSALNLLGNWEGARHSLELGLRIGRARTVGLGFEALDLVRLARAYAGLREGGPARRAAEEAIGAARARTNQVLEAQAHLALAHVLLKTKGTRAASYVQSALSDCERLIEETGARGFLPFLHEERSRLASTVGDDATHERELREAHRLFTEMGATGHAKRLAKELGL